MPGFDGSGPRGMGPMTGGGRGLCAMPLPRTWSRYAAGAAHARYGVRWSNLTPEQELDLLENQAEVLREQLGQIEAKIEELANTENKTRRKE